jgi:hypothetical protein
VQRAVPGLSLVEMHGTRCSERVGEVLAAPSPVILRFGDLFPSVRAGLAFSGEADPPLEWLKSDFVT